MKNWTKVVSLLAGAAILVSMAACNLVTVDENKDKEQVVATVNGVELLKKTYFDAYDGMAYAYQMMGMQPDDTLKTQALDAIVQQEVLNQKAKEGGYDKLTDEETADVQKQYDDALNQFKEGFREDVKTELGEGATDDAIEKSLQERVDVELKNQGVDLDNFKKELTNEKIRQKQQTAFNETVTIDDNDIKAWYDKELETQRASVKENPANFENLSPQIVVPEGYFYVKHVLLSIDEETNTKITELQTSRDPLATELGNLTISDADPATTPQQKAENTTKRADVMKQINDIDKQINDLKAPLNSKAQEVMTKVRSGADFDALITEYGQDPGMATSPQGYLISAKSTTYVQAFTDAAAKLAKVGDVSEPVWSEFGIHIIKRVGDLNPGEKTFDEVKEDARQIVLTQKQTEAWTKQIEDWTTAAKVEKFPDRLDDNRADYNKDQEAADAE